MGLLLLLFSSDINCEQFHKGTNHTLSKLKILNPISTGSHSHKWGYALTKNVFLLFLSSGNSVKIQKARG